MVLATMLKATGHSGGSTRIALLPTCHGSPRTNIEAVGVEMHARLGLVEVGVFHHPIGEVANAADHSTPENLHAPVSRRNQCHIGIMRCE